MQKPEHTKPSADHDSVGVGTMTLNINRRGFLQALIAAGASFSLPVKATKAQTDQVWAEAQANPWFFEVNDHGTLIDGDMEEPEIWADIFGDLTRCDFKDSESIISELSGCGPLTVYLNAQLNKEIESLEENLDATPPCGLLPV